jgi:riboflavin kinase/FMN adenylyltransferase
MLKRLQVFREIKKDLLKASSLALGVFDGVHTGHVKVITSAVQDAVRLGIIPGLVTFAIHPKHIILKSSPIMITSLDERLEIIENLGVKAVLLINFNEEFAKITAEEYIKNVLQASLNAKSLSVGYNHRIGCDKKGAGGFLQDYCAQNNINLNIIPPVKINGHIVSSSVVRELITSGDVISASEFLGKFFSLKGIVIEGQKLGRKIGFPTANLEISPELIIPKRGVYLGLARIFDKEYRCVINVGRKPTVGDFENDIVEVHILEFDKDIYRKTLEVFFIKRIRDEKKFSSLEELKAQIKNDCEISYSYK